VAVRIDWRELLGGEEASDLIIKLYISTICQFHFLTQFIKHLESENHHAMLV
jgi:hypothetical protein